jgi:hypothetical protein
MQYGEQTGCPEGEALDNWRQAEAGLSEAAVRQQKSDVRNIVPKKQHGRRKGWSICSLPANRNQQCSTREGPRCI